MASAAGYDLADGRATPHRHRRGCTCFCLRTSRRRAPPGAPALQYIVALGCAAEHFARLPRAASCFALLFVRPVVLMVQQVCEQRAKRGGLLCFALQNGSYQQPEPDFGSDAFDSGMTSGSDDGDGGPASCDYSDEEGGAADDSPSYGALLPPGPSHGSPHLLDFGAASSHLPGGFFGSPTAALAPTRRGWAPFVPPAGGASAQQLPVVSAFAPAATGVGRDWSSGRGSAAPGADAPQSNPFAVQRKRSWALMQQAAAGEQQPGGMPVRLRQPELDTLRTWSLDFERRHSAPYQGADVTAAVAALGHARRMPTVSSVSLPPTQKPRSFSEDLRELSQLDCEARGFRPASTNSPSVIDIHRMAARLSGMIDAARDDLRPGRPAGGGNVWPGYMGTTSLPSGLGSLASRAATAEAAMQLRTSEPVHSDAGEQTQALRQATADAEQRDGMRSGSSGGGGIVSRAASSDLDPPLTTAWSWGGVAGSATGLRPPSYSATAAAVVGCDAAAKPETLQRLRSSVLASKPPLGWQLGTRSHSSSSGTTSLTPSTASTSWAVTPRSPEGVPASATGHAAPTTASPFEGPASASHFLGAPREVSLGTVASRAALHAAGRSASLPQELSASRLMANIMAAARRAAAAAPTAVDGSGPGPAHDPTQAGPGRTVRAVSMPENHFHAGGPRLERMSNLGPGSPQGARASPTKAATAAAVVPVIE